MHNLPMLVKLLFPKVIIPVFDNDHDKRLRGDVCRFVEIELFTIEIYFIKLKKFLWFSLYHMPLFHEILGCFW